MNDAPVIKELLASVDPSNSFYIDIGCSNEPNLSLGQVRNSDLSVFFEPNDFKAGFYKGGGWGKIEDFHLLKQMVTPENIVDILSGITDRRNPKLLDIDIDGYDYFVLEAVLSEFCPSIILCEINEKIPPPIKFSVLYKEGYFWDNSHFYGMSLSKVHCLLESSYDLTHLNHNNAVYILRGLDHGYHSYTPDDAYDKFYKNNGWRVPFRHNMNVSHWMDLPTGECIEEIKTFFAGREGNYEIG